MKFRVLLLLIAVTFILTSLTSASSKELPKGFVALRDVIPDVKIDLRYASKNNFIGKPVDGYKSNRCILTKKTALALQKVQSELNEHGLCILIYDAYRPQKAVNHFVTWAKNHSDTLMKTQYYPNVAKKNLFKRGFISSKSRHSSGSTVDLTLYSDLLDDNVDMGSPYDFFGDESAITFTKITKKQRANRILLLRTMQKHGFRSYAKEWWHFTLRNEPFKNQYFDFDIQ